MIDVIQDSMLIAARFGAQLGAQMEVDRVINEWARHSANLEQQRDHARQIADKYLASSKAYEQELDSANSKLASLKTELASVSQKLNSRNADLIAAQAKISKMEKALCAQKLRTSEIIDELKKKNEALAEGVKRQICLRNEDRREFSSRVAKANHFLLATRARLSGSERIYGELVSEIFDRGEINRYDALKDTSRRKTLVAAWNEVVRSPVSYTPSLNFSYESLPCHQSQLVAENGAGNET